MKQFQFSLIPPPHYYENSNNKKGVCSHLHTVRLGLSLFFLFMLTLFPFSLRAQFCGTGQNYQLDTIDWKGSPPPVRFLDNEGKEYFVPSLQITSTTYPYTCVAGMFTLHFTSQMFYSDASPSDPSNPFSPSAGEVRRNKICEVFQDLSGFLYDINPTNVGRVNITFDQGTSSPLSLAQAKTYYAFPASSSQLVLDAETQKTITSGYDSYLQYPLGIGMNVSPMSHGNIGINPAFDFHYMTTPPTTSFDPAFLKGEYDFYSIILHEALHTLGIATGGTGYFSRFEKYLTYNTPPPFQPFIQQNAGVWSATTPPALNVGCNTLGSIFYNSTTVTQEPTPNASFQQGHLTCFTGPPYPTGYVMSPGFQVGQFERHPNEIEKNILCNLGYTIPADASSSAPIWGNTNSNAATMTGLLHTYQTDCEPECNVVAVCDTFRLEVNSPPLLIEPLLNDLNANGAIMTQFVSYTPAAGTVSNLTNTSFEWQANPNFQRWAVFSYVPQCANGFDGGTSFILIHVDYCNCSSFAEIGTTNGAITLTDALTEQDFMDFMDPNNSLKCLHIKGTFVIDQLFTSPPAPTNGNFVNVIMEEGARIEILPTNVADFNTTYFHTCSAFMWEGIKLGNSSGLFLTNCVVADAVYGVELTSATGEAIIGTKIDLHHTTFRNCYTGVSVPDISNFAQGDFHDILMEIVDCTFIGLNTSSTLFKQHYQFANQPPIINPVGIDRPFLGLRLHRMTTGLTLDGSNNENLFENLHAGINAKYTTLTIAKCRFKDILTDMDYLNLPTSHPFYIATNESGGTAIYTRNYFGFANFVNTPLTQVGFGNTLSSPISFDNCEQGIHAIGVEVEASNNRMGASNYGIKVEYTSYRNIFLHDNLIGAGNYGICLFNNNSCPQITVSYNTINNSTSNGAGIYVVSLGAKKYNLDKSKPFLHHNYVTVHGNNAKGIHLLNLSHARLRDNDINLPAFVSNQRGIVLENSTELDLNCNHVLGVAYNFNKTAIDVSNTTNSSYVCNSTDKSSVGFRFNMVCGNTRMRGNSIGEHNTGVRVNYDTGTILGEQQLQGNKWSPASSFYASTGSIAAHYLTVLTQSTNPLAYFTYQQTVNNNAFWVKNTTNFNLYPNPASFVNPPAWFNPYLFPGTDSTCNTTLNCGAEYAKIAQLNLIDSLLTLDSLDWEMYEGTPRSMLLRDLFDRLSQDESLQQNPLMLNFYQAVLNENIGKFHTLRTQAESEFSLSDSMIVVIDSMQTAFRSQLTQLRFIDNLLQVTTDSASLDSLNQIAQGIRANANSLCAILLQMGTVHQLQRETAENDLVDAVNTLSVNETWEINQQTVDRLLYKLEAGRTLSESEMQNISAIMWQCPYVGGSAVYEARALYASQYDLPNFDDDSLCLLNNVIWRQSQPAISPKVMELYPNPTQDLLHLRLNVPCEQDKKVEIYNALGLLCKVEVFAQGQEEMLLDLHNFVNGIYYLKVSQQGKTLAVDKFIFLK
ncbi:MAG: T9SS type A sorting domain-containing protein [Bacteroidia bacterium]